MRTINTVTFELSMLLIVFTTYKFTVQFQSSANAAKRKKLERMYKKMSQELKESGGSEKQ